MMRKWPIGIFLLLLIAIGFLPQIAATRFGKPFFVRALEKKSRAKVEVGELHFSWLGPQTFQQIRWSNDYATGTVEELQVNAPFWSFSGPFKLKNGSIAYQNGSVDHIEGQMEGNDFQLNGITLQGHISLRGQVYSKLHFQITVDIKNFPLLIVGQHLDQIFGPTLDLNGIISLEPGRQGRLDLDIASQNVAAKLRGHLSENSVLLREPLLASIRVTPELSALLLKDANPLFLSSLEAAQPATLRIDPNSLIPLPFSLAKLRLQGIFDLGQARCRTTQTAQAIVRLLQAAPSPQMNIWATSLPFRIEHGIVQTGRMDLLLADTLHVCTWGEIDLLNDQLHMSLGIPADTLRKAFGIKNLSENYVLTIPIRGTTKNPELVKGPAIATISALVAGKQISKKGFLGGLSTLIHPKEDETVPPAKRPFPWE